MNRHHATQFGDFTLFGLTKDPEILLQYKVPARLGIRVRTIDFGHAGHFFFYTSYGDVAETEEVIALKLGLAHSPERNPLSSQQLLTQKIVSPQVIDQSKLRGNALVACFSKTDPKFSVYKTLLSMPQMYYTTSDESLLCADNPRCLLALLEKVQVNEEAIPQHFLFRYALGHRTYFRDIYRLMPGQLFRWNVDKIDVSQIRDLRPAPETPTFDRVDSKSMAIFYEKMKGVIGAYLSDAKASGHSVGNMLSGGIDSSVLQILINEYLSSQRKTFSYALRIPSFEFEIGYAREAAQIFQTDHTFVDIMPEDYPAWLVKTIELLTYPIPAESQPCKLALGEYVASHFDEPHFFFVGTGGDTLFGTTMVRKVALLEKVRKFPAARLALKSAALLFGSGSTKAHGLRVVADMLPELDNPYSYRVPANMIAVYTDYEMARRCFGDEAIKKALGYRHSLEERYLGSPHHVEKVHMMELITDAYETGVLVNHLYLANRREQIYPYMDEDVIRASYTFTAGARYLKGHEIKPVLKRILEQKSASTVSRKPKGNSVFTYDLYAWMKDGVLRDMVEAIERPGFLSKADFDRLLQVPDWSLQDEPNWFLWSLLTFDIFQKRILSKQPA
jgi:asparagine synthetase B (glutamine-hydrolysing)